MRNEDLPARWRRRLERYTDETYGPDYKYRGTLSAHDFRANSSVRVAFPDGSSALFRHSFFIRAPEWHEVAVFTEHCGYHILPLEDLDIEHLDGTAERATFPGPPDLT
jgi:hypothetical protein